MTSASKAAKARQRNSGQKGNLAIQIEARLEAAKALPCPPGTDRASNGVTLARGATTYEART